MAIFTLLFLLVRQKLKTDSLLISLGVSFYFLKSAAVLIDSFNQKKPVQMHSIFLMNLFFPVFSAGPLAQWDRFLKEKITRKFEWREIMAGMMRLFIGIFKASYIVALVIDPYIAQTFGDTVFSAGGASSLETLSFVLLSLLSLYIGFSGYTDMAVGGSYIFGIWAPENFRSPYLARNIQEFWKRWHMSLVAITNKYIFSPIVRNTGNIGLAIFSTFVFMGLWHELSFKYLFWGVMHSAGMYAILRVGKFKKARPTLKKYSEYRVAKLLGWAMTMVFVGWLSSFANSNSFGDSINLTRNLIGL